MLQRRQEWRQWHYLHQQAQVPPDLRLQDAGTHRVSLAWDSCNPSSEIRKRAPGMMALMCSRSQLHDRRQKTRVDGRDTTRVPISYCRVLSSNNQFTRVLFGLLSRECTTPHKTRKIDNSLVPLNPRGMFGRTNGNQGQNGEDGSGRLHFPPQPKGCSRFLRSL